MVDVSNNAWYIENNSLDVTKIDFRLDNLVPATTPKKDALDMLVRNNEKLVDQVAELTGNFDILTSGTRNTPNGSPCTSIKYFIHQMK